MIPEIWGKHVWFSIHFIALAYPSTPTYEQRENYKQFYENLWKVLPCKKCSEHYRENIKKMPLEGGDRDYLENNKTLFRWTVQLHNIVNVSLGKPQITLEEAEKIYKPITFQCIVNNSKVDCKEKNTRYCFLWCVAGIIIGSVAVYFLTKK
jgi:hypothetical protein